MQQTDNFSLPLYEANDAPNLLDGYNAAMRTIDTEIKNNADTISSTSSSLAGKAPVDHATSTGTYGVGTNILFGHVQLSDAIDNTANVTSGVAATPYAVKTAHDDLNSIIQDHENMISAKAPINHASNSTTYGVGTASNYGHLKITSTISNTTLNEPTTAINSTALEKYFQFIQTTRADNTYLMNQGYITSETNISSWLYLAQNFDGSLFKVYGSLKAGANIALSNLSKCPDGSYGLYLGKLKKAPSAYYSINVGGTVFLGVTSPLSMYNVNVEVGTDGGVYIPITSTTSYSSTTGFRYSLPACIFSNVDYGDENEQ